MQSWLAGLSGGLPRPKLQPTAALPAALQREPLSTETRRRVRELQVFSVMPGKSFPLPQTSSGFIEPRPPPPSPPAELPPTAPSAPSHSVSPEDSSGHLASTPFKSAVRRNVFEERQPAPLPSGWKGDDGGLERHHATTSDWGADGDFGGSFWDGGWDGEAFGDQQAPFAGASEGRGMSGSFGLFSADKQVAAASGYDDSTRHDYASSFSLPPRLHNTASISYVPQQQQYGSSDDRGPRWAGFRDEDVGPINLGGRQRRDGGRGGRGRGRVRGEKVRDPTRPNVAIYDYGTYLKEIHYPAIGTFKKPTSSPVPPYLKAKLSTSAWDSPPPSAPLPSPPPTTKSAGRPKKSVRFQMPPGHEEAGLHEPQRPTPARPARPPPVQVKGEGKGKRAKKKEPKADPKPPPPRKADDITLDVSRLLASYSNPDELFSTTEPEEDIWEPTPPKPPPEYKKKLEFDRNDLGDLVAFRRWHKEKDKTSKIVVAIICRFSKWPHRWTLTNLGRARVAFFIAVMVWFARLWVINVLGLPLDAVIIMPFLCRVSALTPIAQWPVNDAHVADHLRRIPYQYSGRLFSLLLPLFDYILLLGPEAVGANVGHWPDLILPPGDDEDDPDAPGAALLTSEDKRIIWPNDRRVKPGAIFVVFMLELKVKDDDLEGVSGFHVQPRKTVITIGALELRSAFVEYSRDEVISSAGGYKIVNQLLAAYDLRYGFSVVAKQAAASGGLNKRNSGVLGSLSGDNEAQDDEDIHNRGGRYFAVVEIVKTATSSYITEVLECNLNDCRYADNTTGITRHRKTPTCFGIDGIDRSPIGPKTIQEIRDGYAVKYPDYVLCLFKNCTYIFKSAGGLRDHLRKHDKGYLDEFGRKPEQRRANWRFDGPMRKLDPADEPSQVKSDWPGTKVIRASVSAKEKRARQLLVEAFGGDAEDDLGRDDEEDSESSAGEKEGDESMQVDDESSEGDESTDEESEVSEDDRSADSD